MYAYSLLEPGHYYLIQEEEKGPVILVYLAVVSEQCVFVCKYLETEVMEWKRKSDPIHDILELLSDEAVAAWEEVYNNGTYYEDEE